MENKNDSITPRDVDFAQWYTDVCKKAELMDYSSVKGFIIYRPYGYRIWEEIQHYLDVRFKKLGVENVYMPLVIPESLFNKEKEHVTGFAPEVLEATLGGNQKIEDPLIIRPTSEVLFCDHYAKIISSYRDLPKKYNQWCSVVRWEKTTRPFLRGSEFLWQEGHTMFASAEEARHDALQILELYDKLGRDLLAIPFSKGRKTEKEKFAGALETYGIEALMHDGKALQAGTTHYFGDGFACHFGISYLGKDNKLSVPFQASWGVSTRLIGAIIMVHGDDNGLVLPPYVAPIQVVIVPIQQKRPEVLKKTHELYDILANIGLRVKLDDSDHTPGWKYAEYEMKGVPLRLEVGPRDIENDCYYLVKRNDGQKVQTNEGDLANNIENLLATIHREMYQKALYFLKSHIVEVKTMDEVGKIGEDGGYAKAMWCGDPNCEAAVKERFQMTARCLPFDQSTHGDKCVCCGKKADKVVLFAKAY